MGVKVSFFNERETEVPDTPAKPRLLVPKNAVRAKPDRASCSSSATIGPNDAPSRPARPRAIRSKRLGIELGRADRRRGCRDPRRRRARSGTVTRRVKGALMDTLVKVRDLHKVYYRGSEQIDVLRESRSTFPRVTSLR